MPLATLRDVVLAVQERRIERALVPIENALEGGVDPVLDCLALEAPDVSLVGEIVQPVSYCLAAGGELALEDVTMVLSHPQALGQCKGWIAEHLPRAAVVPAASTAEAVRIVAEEPPARARRSARGSRPGTTGRSRSPRTARTIPATRPGSGGWPAPRRRRPLRTAGRRRRCCCSGAPAPARPGWLVSCLAVFAFAGVNLTRIESRPLAPEDGRIHVLPGPAGVHGAPRRGRRGRRSP